MVYTSQWQRFPNLRRLAVDEACVLDVHNDYGLPSGGLQAFPAALQSLSWTDRTKGFDPVPVQIWPRIGHVLQRAGSLRHLTQLAVNGIRWADCHRFTDCCGMYTFGPSCKSACDCVWYDVTAGYRCPPELLLQQVFLSISATGGHSHVRLSGTPCGS
jgi:hypothetical protein